MLVHLLFHCHLLQTARPASGDYHCSWSYPAPLIVLLHLWSLGKGFVWASVNLILPVYKFMEEVKGISGVVGLVTSTAGRVEIQFSRRLAGSHLGWGVGTFG
jgi:hypothetical protein